MDYDRKIKRIVREERERRKLFGRNKGIQMDLMIEYIIKELILFGKWGGVG